MATIQDIRALELNICEVVEEYLDTPDAYDNPKLHVYLDNDRMEYRAELDEDISGSEDDGVYPIKELVREGEDGPEVDNDRASDIANSWIFLD